MEIAQLVLEYVKVLVWPIFAMTMVLVFRKQLYATLWRLQKASLPGGVSLDFREEIEEAKQLSEKVLATPRPQRRRDVPISPPIPLTEVNARLLALGLQPSPSGFDLSYYRNLSAQDPNLALAGLRIEVDVLARNLARGFGIPVNSWESGARLLKRLHDSGAITSYQMQLTQKILQLSNAAIHGQTVSSEEANAILDIAEVLADQYIYWLSWGFDDDWKPSTQN